MPGLIRLLGVGFGLLVMWGVTAGTLVHAGQWGWWALRWGWAWVEDTWELVSQEHGITMRAMTDTAMPAWPQWQVALEWTIHLMLVMTALSLALYALTPLRFQVREVLGAQWGRTRTVGREDPAYELFRQVKSRCGVFWPVRLYRVEVEQPLAFAMAAPFRSVVVVSASMIERLERKELEFLFAHELAHIRYRDMLLGSVWIRSINSLSWFHRAKVASLNLILRLLLALRLPVILVRALSWFWSAAFACIALGRWFGFKVFLLFDRFASRRIEYRADRFAGEHVDPGAGASLLHRLRGDAEPLFNGLFATHPPIEARIERLRHQREAKHREMGAQ